LDSGLAGGDFYTASVEFSLSPSSLTIKTVAGFPLHLLVGLCGSMAPTRP
jgi:hypothetical protein